MAELKIFTKKDFNYMLKAENKLLQAAVNDMLEQSNLKYRIDQSGLDGAYLTSKGLIIRERSRLLEELEKLDKKDFTISNIIEIILNNEFLGEKRL